MWSLDIPKVGQLKVSKQNVVVLWKLRKGFLPYWTYKQLRRATSASFRQRKRNIPSIKGTLSGVILSCFIIKQRAKLHGSSKIIIHILKRNPASKLSRLEREISSLFCFHLVFSWSCVHCPKGVLQQSKKNNESITSILFSFVVFFYFVPQFLSSYPPICFLLFQSILYSLPVLSPCRVWVFANDDKIHPRALYNY